MNMQRSDAAIFQGFSLRAPYGPESDLASLCFFGRLFSGLT